MNLSIPELIRKKRDGQELTNKEIEFFVKAVVNKTINESQTGAMLMAIYLNKLNFEEITALTKAMILSGETLKFDNFGPEVLVDKHSTGGIGDKVSLVLAPVLASFGLKVPMISGRGLGFTGGTLDKLESIPGFEVNLNLKQMNRCLEEVGCFICGATESLVPADAILYRTRDVTGTVEDQSLSISSILSKKAAEGIETLVMDVKFGKGAMFQTENDAKKVGELMIKVGKRLGLGVRVVTSDMNAPLGKFVGNALEVVEAVMCLRNETDNFLNYLVKLLGAILLESKGIAKNVEEGKEMVENVLKNQKALKIFQKMLTLQGVSNKNAQDLCSGNFWKVLPRAPFITVLKSPTNGFVTDVDAQKIGQACWYLGGGRQTAESQIDHSTGVVLLKTIGDQIVENEPWIEIHHATTKLSIHVEHLIRTSLSVNKNPPQENVKFKAVVIEEN